MTTKDKMKHNWRDGAFRHIFKKAENFVQMYEIFTGTKLCPSEIEFRETGSIIMSKDLKNDVAFLTKGGKFIALVEHQHTNNPNMAFRMLIYYAELLKQHIRITNQNVYGSMPIAYPDAEFYVAYTGKKPLIENDRVVAGDVMIKVNFININYDELEITDNKNVLIGYSYLLKQFEYYCSVELLDSVSAMEKARIDCRQNGYLLNHIDTEGFATMAIEHWTVEQQLEDEKRWAKEWAEERVRIAEEKAEAVAEAMAEAMAEAVAVAEAKVEAKQLEIVKKMLDEKIPIEVIATVIGFTKDEITNISE